VTGIGPLFHLKLWLKAQKPDPLRCRNYVNGPIEMGADEPHERNWLLRVCVVLVFCVLCELLIEINESYFSKHISQNAMLFELMHGSEDNIMVHLNDKYSEHIDKN
jgi:hypothetical protein